MPALCRDCLGWFDKAPGLRCPECAGVRVLAHPELGRLAIAHLDCDAFYAAVEKRDDPSLGDKPVIVGGGRRGVVSTCCYIARVAGVRSAMPMFKALELCPNAVVVRPRMQLYEAIGRDIRERMRRLTPQVEPLSLDEAFLDLAGTERLLGGPPALSMARLAMEIEREVGVTVSVGLSHNKYLAKIASDLDKPRGFAVIGWAETLGFLAPRPVSGIWGVGQALADRLEADGIRTNADLRRVEVAQLVARYGRIGRRLHELALGIDARRVDPDRPVKSISSETTFDEDIGDADRLIGHLWRLAVSTSDRAKARQDGRARRGAKAEDARLPDRHSAGAGGRADQSRRDHPPGGRADAAARARAGAVPPDRGGPRRAGRAGRWPAAGAALCRPKRQAGSGRGNDRSHPRPVRQGRHHPRAGPAIECRMHGHRRPASGAFVLQLVHTGFSCCAAPLIFCIAHLNSVTAICLYRSPILGVSSLELGPRQRGPFFLFCRFLPYSAARAERPGSIVQSAAITRSSRRAISG